MTKMEKVNMIMEVAEDIGLEMGFDELMEQGFRYIDDGFTDEENRETLRLNLGGF